LTTVFGLPRLRRSLLAYLLFNIADLATWVAMLVFAFGRGGASAAAVIAAAQLLPPALITPFGVIIGDRLRPGRALTIAYVLQSGTLAVVACALWFDVPMALLFPLAALDAVAASVARPLYLSSLPSHVQRPDELTAANSVSMMIEEAGMFIGPAVSAILMTGADPWFVYAVFSGGQALAAMLVATGGFRAGARPSGVSPATRTRQASRWRGAFAGLRELRRTGKASLMLGYIGVAWCVAGGMEILAVVLAIDLLGQGDAGPGFLLAAAGIGGLIGAALSVTLTGRQRLAPAIAAAMLLAGLPLTIAGWSPSLLIAGLLFVLAASGRSLLDVAARTLLQQCVRASVMARVFGLHEAMVLGAQAVGVLLVPLLIAAVGPVGAFVVAGVLLPLTCLLTWRRLLRLDQIAVPAPGVALLRGNPIFSPLPAPELERLARCLTLIEVAPGEVVIRQGQLGDRFYLIADGRFEVAVDGMPRPRRGPGEFFGEIALLRNVPRSATVKAVAPSRLYCLSQTDFLTALTGSPAARDAAAEVADRRLAAGRRSV
jgi:hypothetical protein